MYKVLLADDEPSLYESMKENIDWAKYNMQAAYFASNGKDAYEIIRTYEPDIAILDIRMPGYSGLDLSKMIFNEGYKTKVIIVSGYAEFSYAQKAIQYNVIGYCLKPVEYEEIASLLLKAVSNLKNEKTGVSQDDFLEALDADNLTKVKEYLQSIGCLSDTMYLAASQSSMPLSIKDVSIFRVGANMYGYLSQSPFDINQFSEMAHLEGVYGLAIYPTGIGIQNLRSAFFKVIAMCYQSFITPNEILCTYYYDNHSLSIIKEIQEAASFSSRDRIIELLHELLNSEEKRLMSVHSLQKLVNAIVSNSDLVNDPDDNYIYNYKQLTGKYSSLDECLLSLIEMLSASEISTDASGNISNFYFLKIMKYINTYYMKDISLKDVAEVVNLNPNYISQMFKKTTGTTFTQHITDLRIKNAEKLLLTTEDSINDISIQSGFNDYFYFLKIFKKHTGKTPSEFRSSKES